MQQDFPMRMYRNARETQNTKFCMTFLTVKYSNKITTHHFLEQSSYLIILKGHVE